MLYRLRLALERRLAKLTGGVPEVSAPVQSPNEAEAHDWRARGNQFLADDNLEEAESCFRKAERLNANDSNTLTCLGYTLKEQSRFVEARILLRRAVTLIGNVPEAYEATYLIGQIAEQEGDLASAVNMYEETLRLEPGFSSAYEDVCRIHDHLGNEEELLRFLARCIAAFPLSSDYHYRYGTLLLKSQQWSLAVGQFDEAIKQNPNFAEAFCDRGLALHEAGAFAEAIDSYSKAIELKPNLTQAYSNRGALLQSRNEFDGAVADFRIAISLAPDSPIPLTNLSEVLRATRNLEEAISCCDQAMAMVPSDPRPRWNKALALLLRGDIAHGFAHYESRHALAMQGSWSFAQPMWAGDFTLQGQTILLHSEQGLGDTIQFCRYVPMVAALGAKVILEVQKPLLGLLQNLDGVTQIVAKGAPLPVFGCHCPLMSLPFALKTDQSNVPAQKAYLTSDAIQSAKWREKLGEKTLPRVGLVWSGNVDHKNDHNRSIALSVLVDKLPQGCAYFSLQKEVRPTDQTVLNATPWIRSFAVELADFTDTAALCELMDIVVCVDTSVAHLSAAFGRPTAVLLPYFVDWRWMLDRSDSLWYPSVKLYRQEHIGNWDSALLQVQADLALLT